MATSTIADYYDAPIVVIPDTPPQQIPLPLPQPLIDDSSQVQDWSNHTNKDTLRLQISSHQNQQAQLSPYLNSPVSSSTYLSSPISPPSSSHSLSPGGLATAFEDFTLVDDSSPQDPYTWNLERNVLQDPSSLSRDGSLFSDGLNLTISMANDQVNNGYPSSAASEDNFGELFLNFEESSNIVDYDSFSQTDFGPYVSPQQSESTGSFFAPLSPVPPVTSAFTDAGLLSDVNQGILQRRHSHSYTSKSQSPCEVPELSLMLPDEHDNSKQLRRHSYSTNNSLTTSGISTPSASSLLSPDSMTLAESNNSQLQRRHSHSGSSQRPMETVGQPHRRAKSIHGQSPYARPRDIGVADAYPNLKPDNHVIYHDTRTPEHSAPPSPLPSSSPRSQDVQQITGDMFRRYDSHSGTTYPMLQRDTIASDAVLQASAKRRKKAAMHACPTCGQMLTSKDNLNNHMDAHNGIRRHLCEYCHERFRTRSVLKRHQKSNKCPASRFNLNNEKPHDPSSLQVPPS